MSSRRESGASPPIHPIRSLGKGVRGAMARRPDLPTCGSPVRGALHAHGHHVVGKRAVLDLVDGQLLPAASASDLRLVGSPRHVPPYRTPPDKRYRSDPDPATLTSCGTDGSGPREPIGSCPPGPRQKAMARSRGEPVPPVHHLAPAPSRTWRTATAAASLEVRDLLTRAGGVEDKDLAGDRETWRVRLGKTVFTGYDTGTIYCTGGREPELQFLYQRIAGLLRS